MKDINDRSDIMKLVDAFYGKVKEDSKLAPVFTEVDLPKHMPTMYNFWSAILLGDRSYQGNPFQKHIRLVIDSTHFTKWLELFNTTVDELFVGYRANEAKERARIIAGTFQYKMGLIKQPPFDQPF